MRDSWFRTLCKTGRSLRRGERGNKGLPAPPARTAESQLVAVLARMPLVLPEPMIAQASDDDACPARAAPPQGGDGRNHSQPPWLDQDRYSKRLLRHGLRTALELRNPFARGVRSFLPIWLDGTSGVE
jgi:hypothetical protein